MLSLTRRSFACSTATAVKATPGVPHFPYSGIRSFPSCKGRIPLCLAIFVSSWDGFCVRAFVGFVCFSFHGYFCPYIMLLSVYFVYDTDKSTLLVLEMLPTHNTGKTTLLL